jgi:iron complex transport system ATP-binding protein
MYTDLNLVQYFGDKVIMLNGGQVVSYGSPKDVLESEKLKNVYGIDIKKFMVEVLEKWQ